MARPSPKWILAAFLSVLTAILLPATLGDSATVDEPDHLMAGLSYWRTGHFSIGCDHPPLARLWTALPVLFLGPDLAPISETAQASELYRAGVDTLYYLGNPTEPMLFWGRFSNWLLALLCAGILYRWSSSLFGDWAGLVSSLAFILNPGVLAHGRLITTDMGACLGYLLGCWGLSRAVSHPTLKNTITASLLVAVAFCLKFNTLPLLVVIAFVLLSRSKTEKDEPLGRAGEIVKAGSVSLLVLMLAIWILYLFQTGPIASVFGAFLAEIDRDLETFAARIPFGLGAVVVWVLETVPVPAPAFWSGIGIVASIKREAFLFGTHSPEGRSYYLPAAFLLKTPVPLLVLYLSGLVAALVGWRQHPQRKALTVVFVALGFYWLVGCVAKWSIGYRHLLPVVPLHALLVGSLLSGASEREKSGRGWNVRILVVVAMIILTGISLVQHSPVYLSYFNFLCGGSQNGHRYLIDSNLDWGQDVLRLKRYCEDRGIEKATGEIFCPDNLRYHGLEIETPKTFEGFQERISNGAYGFVSGNFLVGIHEEARTRWKGLDQLSPRDRIGDSIFVYGGPR